MTQGARLALMRRAPAVARSPPPQRRCNFQATAALELVRQIAHFAAIEVAAVKRANKKDFSKFGNI